MVRQKQEYWQGEPEEFTEDQGGTQHWQGLYGKISLNRAGERVQSLPVLCAARAGEAFGAQPDIPSPTGCLPASRTPAVPSAKVAVPGFHLLLFTLHLSTLNRGIPNAIWPKQLLRCARQTALELESRFHKNVFVLYPA